MPFGSLWLPVLASGVAVWIASSIVHMVLGFHKADYKGLANEDEVALAMRKGNPAPGYYAIPYCSDMKEMGTPAMKKKLVDGPRAFIAVVKSGEVGMGKPLLLWLGLCILISFISAYVARHTLDYGTDGMTVLRITATVAFAAYGMGYLADVIWRGIPLSNSLRGLLDAVIYAAVTGLVFMGLWPAVS